VIEQLAVTAPLLTTEEQHELARCELIIERGLQTFLEVGRALITIRDRKLYRRDYHSFAAYCRTRWNMSRPRAYQLIGSVAVMQNLSTLVDIPLPTHESHTRWLLSLTPGQQRETWKLATATARSGNVTAKHVRAIVQSLTQQERQTLKKLSDALSQQETEARRAERLQRLRELSLTSLTRPQGCYPILYADPPWRYDHFTELPRAVDTHYPTMALEDICSLPVGELTTPDALLFLWATSGNLAEAFSVMTAWGFQYCASMVWVKDKIGMGYYCRLQHEFLLIAKRGNPPPPSPQARVSSVVYAPRQAHSQKPEAFYQVIERMYPTLPKLELFARSTREGWQGWGNEMQ
jgi:N6-adenosine-specific RNA methylase IME4